MNLHKHQLYLLEQHSESFKIWSAVIRINTVFIRHMRCLNKLMLQTNYITAAKGSMYFW